MLALFLESRRDGYSPDQCGKTLTVGELIAYLEGLDEDTPIYVSNDNGYTYGSISYNDIREEYVKEEEEEE